MPNFTQYMVVGCTRLRTLREIPLPSVSTELRVWFAILCALAVCPSDGWASGYRVWATGWLDGSDRSERSACAAAEAAAAPLDLVEIVHRTVYGGAEDTTA